MTDMATFIEGMPKADLHLHIEGALEPEMKFEMAARNGFSLPYKTVDDVALSAFTNSLRNQVDLEALSDGINLVARDTLQPATVSIWLR